MPAWKIRDTVTPALSKAAQPTAGTDAQAEPQGERPVPKLVLEKDLLDVFGPSGEPGHPSAGNRIPRSAVPPTEARGPPE